MWVVLWSVSSDAYVFALSHLPAASIIGDGLCVCRRAGWSIEGAEGIQVRGVKKGTG